MATTMNKHQIPEVLPAGMTVEDIEIPVPWGHVAGRWWGPRNKQPMIAIHGWQENAGAWDNLIPLLPPSTSILCIDQPGHGLSSHYPTGMPYYLFWDGILLIRRIVKHFKWNKITLIGHSLGGALSFMYAASFPNDVEKLICVDVASPADLAPKNAVNTTGSDIDKFFEYDNVPEEKVLSCEYEQLIDIAYDAYQGSVTKDNCKVLLKRGARPTPAHIKKGGYYITRDVKLKVTSLALMTLETAAEYAVKIKCKVLNIRAISGYNQRLDCYLNIIEKLRRTTDLRYEEVEGTHHVHLNAPERIAPFIREFLNLY